MAVELKILALSFPFVPADVKRRYFSMHGSVLTLQIGRHIEPACGWRQRCLREHLPTTTGWDDHAPFARQPPIAGACGYAKALWPPAPRRARQSGNESTDVRSRINKYALEFWQRISTTATYLCSSTLLWIKYRRRLSTGR